MIVIALGLLALAMLVWVGRLQPKRPPKKAEDAGLAEARAVLGVAPGASAEQIREAYARLMHLNHPDRGGSHGAAARLNEARDRLLKG